MRLLSDNSGKSGSNIINGPPNPSTRPLQGQPRHPLSEYV